MNQKEKYPCPVKTCEKYGRKCFQHCNHCGTRIRWRPSKLDPEIAYAGPKPLDMEDKLHRCMLNGTSDGKYYDTRKAIPSHIKSHLRFIRDLGRCPVDDCYFKQIDKEKDPVIFEAWNKKRAEWLQKYPSIDIQPSIKPEQLSRNEQYEYVELI